MNPPNADGPYTDPVPLIQDDLDNTVDDPVHKLSSTLNHSLTHASSISKHMDHDEYDNPEYNEKLKYEHLSSIMSEIGFGKYQWKLFFVCGLGYVADSLWFRVNCKLDSSFFLFII